MKAKKWLKENGYGIKISPTNHFNSEHDIQTRERLNQFLRFNHSE